MQRISVDESTELLIESVEKFVSNADKLYPGAGWSQFVNNAYRAPLDPAKFEVKAPQAPQGGGGNFLKSLFGG